MSRYKEQYETRLWRELKEQFDVLKSMDGLVIDCEVKSAVRANIKLRIRELEVLAAKGDLECSVMEMSGKSR
ncbi:hypothetical protein [Pseudomonas chlororaphis]|uniref:Phage protein n=1 Tax=Pseudomonas chlororaphis TaxID=587753 RepID=A0A1Q8ESN2_9PSED|nr:hypothetical protein [Pseudomonas chlororaphis]OLF54803.1 hypothetical protein BTN82_07285 [Pseudomonas chlororaphis]